MKVKFIEDTNNIRSLTEAMQALVSRDPEIPGLGLICGNAGLGKTRSTKWYAVNNDCPYLRARAIWTPRIMLQDLCVELGSDPEYGTAKVFDQVRDILDRSPRLIFIDEVDHMTANWKMLETLRDLHDITETSFVFVGEVNIKSKLAKKHRLWRRISQIVEFAPLKSDEIQLIVSELLDTPIDQAAIDLLISNTKGFFGDVMVDLSAAEKIIKANPEIKKIDMRVIKAAHK